MTDSNKMIEDLDYFLDLVNEALESEFNTEIRQAFVENVVLER